MALMSASLLGAAAAASAQAVPFGRTDITLEPVHRDDSTEHMSFSDVRMYTLSSTQSGRTSVVEGLVHHGYPEPRRVYIGLDFLDGEETQLLRAGQFVSGKTVSPSELEQGQRKSLAGFLTDIQRSSGVPISPGENIPFMFIVPNTPGTAESYEVRVLYSEVAEESADVAEGQGSPGLVLRNVRWELAPGPALRESPLVAHMLPEDLDNDIVLLQGQVLNISAEPARAVRLEALMYDQEHKVLQREERFAGIDEPPSPSNAEQGQQASIPPGREAPFTIPFIMPEQAVSFEVRILDTQP